MPSTSLSGVRLIQPKAIFEVEYDLGAGPRQETVGGRSTYHHQLDAFIAAVEDGVVPLTGGVDSVATMTVIDEAYRSAGLPPRGT